MTWVDVSLWVAGFALGWFGFDVVKKIWQRRKNEKLIAKMEEDARREASRQKRSAAQKAAAAKRKQVGNIDVLKMQAPGSALEELAAKPLPDQSARQAQADREFGQPHHGH